MLYYSACRNIAIPQVPMDTTIQGIVQDITILHYCALLVFTVHALAATSINNCNTCLLTAFRATSICNRNTWLLASRRDATIQATIQLDAAIPLMCCTFCSVRLLVFSILACILCRGVHCWVHLYCGVHLYCSLYCSICLYTVGCSYTHARWSLRKVGDLG